MRKWKQTVPMLLLLFCLAAIAGCSGREEPQDSPEPFEIGVVTKSRDSEYWMAICSGMEKASSELGVKLTILYSDTESDKEIQKKMIAGLIGKKVDAIAVSPIDSYDNKDYLKKAQQADIPVYAYDTRIMDADVPYIGVDNEKIGYELAEKLAELLGHQGKVGIVSGVRRQYSHEGRIKGFIDYISTQPDMELVFVESGYSNLQMSEKEIAKILEQYPDLSGIMATSAVTALGIQEGIKGTGIQVVTVDVQEDALQAVKDGEIAALAAQSGYDVGYAAIQYIVNACKGKEQDKEVILPASIITGENVEDYLNLKK